MYSVIESLDVHATHYGFTLVRHEGVARLRFNRPELRNSLSNAVCTSLHAALTELATDTLCRTLVVEGSGGSFASGADIVEMNRQRSDPPQLRDMYRMLRDTQELLYTMPQPTVALIDGYCIGAGLSLAMACDIRIASTGSSFAAPPARFGLLYSNREIWRLALHVGMGRVRELLFTGRSVSDLEALQMGLVGRLVAPEKIEMECTQLLTQIAAASPTAVRMAKQQMLQLERSGAAHINDETDAEAAFFSADAGEGLLAFIERRAPRFRNPS